MLDGLRRGAQTWVAKVLLGILVFSFAIWGISDIFVGQARGPVAKVGETNVDRVEFSQAYRQALYNYSQRFRRSLTPQEASLLGVPAQVLGNLTAEASFGEMARVENLGASDGEVARLIRDNPIFHSTSGQFDRALFEALISQYGFTEARYVDFRRRAALQRQISSGLLANLNVPTSYLEALEKLENETRAISYVLMDKSLADKIADPDESELKSYFEDNKSDYDAPEYRSISWIQADARTLVKPSDITQEVLRKTYNEQRKARYTEPEKRRILQLKFDSRAEADKARGEVLNGKTLLELAQERGLNENDIDLGLQTKEDLIDNTIAQPAFSLPEGSTSGVIEGKFVTVILEVKKVIESNTRPLEEVENELRASLAQTKGRQNILQLFDDVEDARAEGASLAEVANRVGLDLKTVDAIDRSGKDKNDRQNLELAQQASLLAAAFDADIDDDSDPVQIGTHGHIWFNVNEIAPTRQRAFDEVANRVKSDWIDSETAAAVSKRANELQTEFAGGKSLSNIAAEIDGKVLSAEQILRSGKEGLQQALVTATFGGPQGHKTLVRLAGDSFALLEVTDTLTPAYFAESESAKRNQEIMTRGIAESLLQEFILGLQQEYGVTTNQNAIFSVIDPNYARQ